ncbi:MAG: hypothetical protein MN733_30825, partial [Nitrososphaera sp.]|nr:hypothetical protein [Nitrososphaera sp.]
GITIHVWLQLERWVLGENFRKEAVDGSALHSGGKSPNALARKHVGHWQCSTLGPLMLSISLVQDEGAMLYFEPA